VKLVEATGEEALEALAEPQVAACAAEEVPIKMAIGDSRATSRRPIFDLRKPMGIQ